ncbi:MAG: hypothetical protein ACE5GZ_11065 [Gammaproteobacteria bacterium]
MSRECLQMGSSDSFAWIECGLVIATPDYGGILPPVSLACSGQRGVIIALWPVKIRYLRYIVE